MEDLRNNTAFQGRFEERLLLGLAAAIVVAVAIIVIGCAAIPAVLATLYGWPWLLFYPGIVAAGIFAAGRKKP